MKRALIIILKRIWILPATYLLIYKMRINEEYPNTFMLIMLVFTMLLLVCDFYKNRTGIN